MGGFGDTHLRGTGCEIVTMNNELHSPQQEMVEDLMAGATLETVRAYVDAQGIEEHTRKSAAKVKTNSLRDLDRFRS